MPLPPTSECSDADLAEVHGLTVQPLLRKGGSLHREGGWGRVSQLDGSPFAGHVTACWLANLSGTHFLVFKVKMQRSGTIGPLKGHED